MPTSLWIALGLTLALVFGHAVAPRLRRIPFVPEPVITSFSGGFAVSFIFLHTLPGLLENRMTLGALLEERLPLTPLVELAVFFVALLGFTTFMALELYASRRAGGSDQADRTFFYLHLGSYGVYNLLVTYSMPLRVEASFAFAAVFTLAMGLHWVINDRTIERHHPRMFARQGRGVLIGALVLGWVLAAVTEPDSIVTVAFFASFLAGAILSNVFKEEIPSERDSSLSAFIGGELTGALLLLLITGLEG
jgi:hypothetical protein